jgi:hypothetical protein
VPSVVIKVFYTLQSCWGCSNAGLEIARTVLLLSILTTFKVLSLRTTEKKQLVLTPYWLERESELIFCPNLEIKVLSYFSRCHWTTTASAPADNK